MWVALLAERWNEAAMMLSTICGGSSSHLRCPMELSKKERVRPACVGHRCLMKLCKKERVGPACVGHRCPTELCKKEWDQPVWGTDALRKSKNEWDQLVWDTDAPRNCARKNGTSLCGEVGNCLTTSPYCSTQKLVTTVVCMNNSC